jgi:hypothetical protein
MDIHAPDHPILSFKEFGVHIAVVTVGILIALGLEGVREVIHDRHLVREARENFHTELSADREHVQHEIPAVKENNDKLLKLISDLPALQRDHPDQIAARLLAIENPGYFFALQSWPTAMSTGALAHMPVEDIQIYASSYGDIQIYTALQKEAMTAGDRAHAFFLSRPSLTPFELEEGAERILLFQRTEQTLVNVGKQMQFGFDHALQL